MGIQFPKGRRVKLSTFEEDCEEMKKINELLNVPLTVEEYAKKHGKSTQRIYQLIDQGRLKVSYSKGVALIADAKFPVSKKLGRPKFRSLK